MPDAAAPKTQLETAALLVWEKGKASTSLVQRQLSIGYNKAARLVERMEQIGLVSAPNHVGKREVYSAPAMIHTLKGRGIFTEGFEGLESAELIRAADASVMKMESVHDCVETSIDKIEKKARKDRPPMKRDPDFKEHNTQAYRITVKELRSFIERFERLDEEKRAIADQQKEVMAEAKARGYDTKVMRKVVALRKRDADDIAEEEAVLEMYKEALGM